MKHLLTLLIFTTQLSMTGPLRAKPLKVFILAGQSNMQGHAAMTTFDSLANDPKTAAILQEMRNADGTLRVCEKVWISSVGCAGDGWSDVVEQKGKLTAGFGASTEKIGPEFTFGIYMEKALDEPILIVKTAWGGRNLMTDFRPPSTGKRVFNDYFQKRWTEMGVDPEKEAARHNRELNGVFYRHMIDHIQMVLKDIKRVVPDYDPKQGYELGGFVWFQGFNDYVDDWSYPGRMKPGGYDEYAELLGHLIRDVRKDLSAPKMPFVIGVMGIGGVKEGEKPPQMYFRQAQAAPASLPEFQGNVLAVPTEPFWDEDLETLQSRMEACWPKVDARVAEEMKQDRQADKWENKMKIMAENFAPAEWKRLQGGVSNGGYHYLGAAKIMAPIGKAFAEAIVNLQSTQPQQKQ